MFRSGTDTCFRFQPSPVADVRSKAEAPPAAPPAAEPETESLRNTDVQKTAESDKTVTDPRGEDDDEGPTRSAAEEVSASPDSGREPEHGEVQSGHDVEQRESGHDPEQRDISSPESETDRNTQHAEPEDAELSDPGEQTHVSVSDNARSSDPGEHVSVSDVNTTVESELSQAAPGGGAQDGSERAGSEQDASAHDSDVEEVISSESEGADVESDDEGVESREDAREISRDADESSRDLDETSREVDESREEEASEEEDMEEEESEEVSNLSVRRLLGNAFDGHAVPPDDRLLLETSPASVSSADAPFPLPTRCNRITLQRNVVVADDVVGFSHVTQSTRTRAGRQRRCRGQSHVSGGGVTCVCVCVCVCVGRRVTLSSLTDSLRLVNAVAVHCHINNFRLTRVYFRFFWRSLPVFFVFSSGCIGAGSSGLPEGAVNVSGDDSDVEIVTLDSSDDDDEAAAAAREGEPQVRAVCV